MSLKWKEENLDLILVPIGLFIMFSYHLYLLYRYLKFPQTTAIGCEDHYKRAWVEKSMQLEAKDKGPSVTVINSNITAATTLSSISLVLSSLIGTWIGSSSEKNIFSSSFIYGDTRPTSISIKYITLLTCFLVAFASFVQATRNYVLAAFLITIPNSEIPVSYVQKPVIRGSHFWTVGMRAFYIASTLIMWIFGPIPMFVSSVTLVAVIYNLDRNSTPLYQFDAQLKHSHFQKIGEELAAVSTAFRHQERSNVD